MVCPRERDYRAIREAGLEERYRVRYASADLDDLASFDAGSFVEECDRIPADAVVGANDLAALLAAIIAERRGLPGPRPAALIACQLKPAARALGRIAAPAATPAFAVLDGPPFAPPPLRAPFFVKPVVNHLSQDARRVDHPSELDRLEAGDYAIGYGRIAELAGLDARSVRAFLAEELLPGPEVTLEGYMFEGEMTVIGVTDSVKYAGTNSFERFEYPSLLPRERLEELTDVAARLLPALGFDGGFFNVEFSVPEDGPARVIEVNGRVASQFWPLVLAVDGRSTYEALFALACGEDPGWRRSASRRVAISYCMRAFADAHVVSVPAEDGLELLVQPGQRLSEQGHNDVRSYRLCIFSEVADVREEAVARCLARARLLWRSFGLEPVPDAASAALGA